VPLCYGPGYREKELPEAQGPDRGACGRIKPALFPDERREELLLHPKGFRGSFKLTPEGVWVKQFEDTPVDPLQGKTFGSTSQGPFRPADGTAVCATPGQLTGKLQMKSWRSRTELFLQSDFRQLANPPQREKKPLFRAPAGSWNQSFSTWLQKRPTVLLPA
jgi:hypothetical protein